MMQPQSGGTGSVSRISWIAAVVLIAYFALFAIMVYLLAFAGHHVTHPGKHGLVVFDLITRG